MRKTLFVGFLVCASTGSAPMLLAEDPAARKDSEDPPAVETIHVETDPAPDRPPREPAAAGDDALPDPDLEPPDAGLLPDLDFYFPEGELDFRLSGLIEGAFYEGQLRYNFVDGDIRAFVRYRYYGERRIHQLSLFDTVEFEAIEKGGEDFERVRGGLYLAQWPHGYHRRSFFLAEVDRLTSNKEEFQFTTNRTNTFIRIGHQIGTPDDERSNSIVGESRARIERLFTPHKLIGPYGAGLTAALTWGIDDLGDFDYSKFEFEALKRFDLGRSNFLVSRLHGGTFLHKRLARDEAGISEADRYAIPRFELFRLDGRDNLRGVDQRLRGTEELHTTVEYFLPWFLEDSRRALKLDWNNWYWVGYAGVGAIGFDREIFSDTGNYVPDAGLGFQASASLKDYQLFVSAVLAHALHDVGGFKARLSLKLYD